MPMFRKKPVTIEARQFTDFGDGIHDLLAWCGGMGSRDALGRIIEIETLEGTMLARPGDWIIKGVKGEFYPIKNEIFAATYEAVQP